MLQDRRAVTVGLDVHKLTVRLAAVRAGEVIAEFGHQADRVYVIAHGRVNKIGAGKYGNETMTGVLADGQYFGEQMLLQPDAIWEFTAKAATVCTVVSLPKQVFQEVAGQSPTLTAHLGRVAERSARPWTR